MMATWSLDPLAGVANKTWYVLSQASVDAAGYSCKTDASKAGSNLRQAARAVACTVPADSSSTKETCRSPSGQAMVGTGASLSNVQPCGSEKRYFSVSGDAVEGFSMDVSAISV